MAKKKKSLIREIGEIAIALIIAWAFYQVLVFSTGSPLPVVSVVSSSMHHEQVFDDWWVSSGKFYESKGINKDEFRSMPMSNGFAMGDLLFVVREEPSIGDVIIYQRNSDSTVIVHRVIEFTENGYITKGDNNSRPDNPVSGESIFGKAVFSIPLLGWPRTLLHTTIGV